MDYAVEVYEFAADLPEAERYNLTSQLRRAVTSVPLNIAEGAGCGSSSEFVKFLSYAYRSLKEVITCLELCNRIYRFPSNHAATRLAAEGDQIARMIYALMHRLRRQPSSKLKTDN